VPDKFHKMEIVDIPSIASAVTEQWVNVVLAEVGESEARLAVIRGEYHFHHHQMAEFFLVLEGEVFIDMERDGVTETVKLGHHQGYVVAGGTTHRTRAPERAQLLMVVQLGASPDGV
jgi:mannose-6-phosphate isomerase-like protein (cupin superfamily)